MDLNVRAFRVVQEAVNGDSRALNPKKETSRRGGLKGGPSRARSVSQEERIAIAKKASNARWRKEG